MLEPIAIPDAESRCFTIGYYCKGHEDKKVFCEAVKVCHEVDIPEDRVQHTFFRVVRHGEFGSILVDSTQGRGAFPVTVIDV